jgi:hypothetical protein
MSKTGIISRAASLLVVAGWVCLAALDQIPQSVQRTLGLAFILGLPLIWFSETISSMTLPIGRGPSFETPPFLVAFAGWVFLLGVPLIVGVLLNDVGR